MTKNESQGGLENIEGTRSLHSAGVGQEDLTSKDVQTSIGALEDSNTESNEAPGVSKDQSNFSELPIFKNPYGLTLQAVRCIVSPAVAADALSPNTISEGRIVTWVKSTIEISGKCRMADVLDRLTNYVTSTADIDAPESSMKDALAIDLATRRLVRRFVKTEGEVQRYRIEHLRCHIKLAQLIDATEARKDKGLLYQRYAEAEKGWNELPKAKQDKKYKDLAE